MTHPGHGRTECSCGAVIAQCRCNDQHREVHVVQAGCGRCRGGVTATLTTVAEWEQARQARAYFTEACALLRRAGAAITTLECEALVLDGDDHDEARADGGVLLDIAAFLARVDPR